MKKFLLPGLFICFFSIQIAHAQQESTTTGSPKATSSTKNTDYNPWFVPLDILVTRPLGLAATITGTALFIVFSPFTALSAIAPPHDAFERVADVFIIVPSTYTFLRPVGKFLCPGDCRPADIK
ncbi:MAG: hypothetical protein DRQ62_09380 [Gammaproteobacteria bacterium]|nr:MAG: hypothetical protein DRQ62_09380 [Gammaproteobacteria bacterium]